MTFTPGRREFIQITLKPVRCRNKSVVPLTKALAIRWLVSPAHLWSPGVYLTQVVPVQVNTLPLNHEVPLMISNEDIHCVEVEIPFQLIYISPGSGLGYHHGKVSATGCGAGLTDRTLMRS